MKDIPVSTPSYPSPSTPSSGYCTTARDFVNPVDYKHPHASMAQFADLLALSYDANRTRHAYYRHVRVWWSYGLGGSHRQGVAAQGMTSESS